MNLNILFIDDDEKIRNNLVNFFDREEIEGHTLIATNAATFEEGKKIVRDFDFDIIILDLYQGEPKEGNDKLGIEILKEIQSIAFIPIIFYSGLTKDLSGIESEIVGVVNKGAGIEQLKIEIARIIKSNIALIKRRVNDHVRLALRDYFWKTVHEGKHLIEPIKNDISIGYLLLRRLAHSLSKENIKSLLLDDKIQSGKAHPMEFYIFPSDSGEYECGEILKKGDRNYAILTPDCDMVLRSTGKRKAEYVLLATTSLFIELEDYKKYSVLKAKTNKTDKELNEQLPNLEGKLRNWMSNTQGEKDRYFFLPGTPFIENSLIDFQNKIMVKYEDLREFTRVAKLDTPFAQSMASSFTRFYNRIGYPDIDSKYIIDKF